MEVKTIKTHKITSKDKDLLLILEKYLPRIENNSVVVVTSKIVSICEGRVVPCNRTTKAELIQKEADLMLEKSTGDPNIPITIKNGIFISAAGIDESNGDKQYILWPKDSQKSAQEIRQFLVSRYNIENVGVVITDSKIIPLRIGTTGIALGYAGFEPLHDYRHTKDLFGKDMWVSRSNIADGLAASAVLLMGEGAEQTPIAVIRDVAFVKFTEKELPSVTISKEEDLYAPLYLNVRWKKGKK